MKFAGTSARRFARDCSHWTPGPSGSPFDQQRAARIDPEHVAGGDAPRPQQRSNRRRRPELAVAGDQVAHGRRRRPHQAHRLQDPRDVVAVLVQVDDEAVKRSSSSSSARAMPTWTQPQTASIRSSSEASCCSARPTSESSASVTPRQADSTTALRGAGSDSMIAGDPFHAGGIRHAGPAELVNFPGFQESTLLRTATRPRCPVARKQRTGTSADGRERVG